MSKYTALVVEKSEEGMSHSLVQLDTNDLPEGEVLIKVSFSSVNYKDAMSMTGVPGVTRQYPHTPGIDAAGVVAESTDGNFSPGDEIICIGYDLGMNTSGGFGEYIRVPSKWISKLPEGLSLKDSMIIGTAGFTAALCLEKLELMGASPEDGPVLVTGATGGVGSICVMLLSQLGYEVVACTGKTEKKAFLMDLGAGSILDRAELSEPNKRPVLAPRWAHAIDCVGGEILSNIIKELSPQGSVAICGLVASPGFSATVLPFILRGVNVLGIDSVEIPIDAKNRIWDRLASDWKLSHLSSLSNEITLSGLGETTEKLLAGLGSGRTLVKVG
ncbi:MAG: YhdH/YhfP family quinone oxidoreductase [Pseudomonadales bacterium]|nr:YhdH/YhfP family quinone oxidoreductase [Pseudomonadales bacterium]